MTGTRGKSSVTRLVAAGLSASGARVLAKTTGSRPVLILPDGAEEEIVRAGGPSIREQVRLVRRAARLGAEALVVEMMSIGGEYLRAESAILRPQLLVLTNVRPDHLEAMGADEEAIARTLTSAFPEAGRVLMPAEERRPVFDSVASRLGLEIVHVPAGPDDGGGEAAEGQAPGEFEPNRRLALAALGSLGVDGETARQGLAKARPDAGSLAVYDARLGTPPRPALCVNAFAANEPASSAMARRRIEASYPVAGRPLVAVLSLREDRGDRTLQWVRAARDGFFRGFSSVFLVGPPARAALRKVRRGPAEGRPAFGLAGGRSAAEVMDQVMAAVAGEPVIFGFGNYVGRGDDIVRYWRERSRP